MAKKEKLFDTSKAPLVTCCKCGKKGGVVIGPAGKGICDECYSKANKLDDKHKVGFVNDLNGQGK